MPKSAELSRKRSGAAVMASKGKKEKGSTAVPVPEVPPEREVIPGKVTETQWREWVEKEESLDVAGEVVQGLLDLAFSLGQEHYLEEEAFSYTVEEARLSLLQIIEWEFLQRDEGERDPGNDPSWQEDDEPVCSVIDSWARGSVPETSQLTDHQSSTAATFTTPTSPDDPPLQDLHINEASLQYDDEVSTANSGEENRQQQQQQPRASTVGSSSANTSTSRTLTTRHPQPQKVLRARPQARRPQARLLELARTQSQDSATSKSPTVPQHTDLAAPSPPPSVTPTSSLLSHPHSSPPPPPLLPYNMKPAQLRWQKDVTYDSSGKIVDMLRLDPSSFPSHRVRPRVGVSDPGPARRSRQAALTSLHKHTSPGAPHVKKTSNTRAGRGAGEGVRRGEGVRVRSVAGSTGGRERGSRFPEILTLPALVDTIDPSAGVCVREGNRSVCGPSSPSRPPHFLLPHTAMLPVTLSHSLPPTATGNTN